MQRLTGQLTCCGAADVIISLIQSSDLSTGRCRQGTVLSCHASICRFACKTHSSETMYWNVQWNCSTRLWVSHTHCSAPRGAEAAAAAMWKLKLPLHNCMLEGCKNDEPILYANTRVHSMSQHCLNPNSQSGSKRNCHACSMGNPSLSPYDKRAELVSVVHMYISGA